MCINGKHELWMSRDLDTMGHAVHVLRLFRINSTCIRLIPTCLRGWQEGPLDSSYAAQDTRALLSCISLVAQMVKNLSAMQESWIWSLGQEDTLEKRMATHPSILAWRIPRTEATVYGFAESDTSEPTNIRTTAYLYGGYECGQTQGDGEDRRAWRTAVYGVSKSWTWLSDWTTNIYIGWDKVPLGKKWILMAFCQEKITLLRIQRVSPALACISWQVPHCFIIRVANIIGIKRRTFFS